MTCGLVSLERTRVRVRGSYLLSLTPITSYILKVTKKTALPTALLSPKGNKYNLT